MRFFTHRDLSLTPLFLLVVSAGVQPAVAMPELEVLALTADPAPGGPDGAVFLEFGLSEINNLGQVAFVAAMEPGVAGVTTDEALGVWYASPGGVVTPVTVGDPPAPGVPGAFFDTLATAPQFSDVGIVSADFLMEIGPGGVTSGDQWGRWLFPPNGPGELVYRDRSAPPGVDPEAEIVAAFGPMNRGGDLAMRATLAVGPGGVTSSTTAVIWKRLADGTETFVARSGFVAPDAPAGTFFNNIGVADINENGVILSRNTFRQGLGGVTEDNDGAIYSDRSGAYTLEYREGDLDPDGNVFESLSVAGLNNQDQILFISDLPLDPNGGPFNDEVLWAETANGLRAVARTGDTLPGTGTSPLRLITNTRFNDAGRVAFAGALIPGRVDWIFSEGLSGDLQLVAEEGTAAPGTEPGVVFDSDLSTRLFGSDMTLNNAGQVAFTSALAGAGVTEANDGGLWAQGLDGELRLIVREGDPIEVAPGDSRIVERFASAGMNESGQVGFDAAFTDGSFGVFVSNVVARLPGDYNSDGLVDAADYTVWRDAQGGTGIGLAPDGNSDGTVDQTDYDVWALNYGAAATVDATTVPEPANLLAVLFGSVALINCGLRTSRSAISQARP